MASTDALPIPRKNEAFRVTFPIFDADGDLVTGAAGLDSEISKDAGAFADCTNEATEIAQGIYYLDLTSTEMNADTVAIIVKTSTSGAKTTPIILYPAESADVPVNVTAISGDTAAADNLESYTDGTTPQPVNATQISGDSAAADNAEAFFDGTGYAGGTIKLGVDTVAISGDATAADNAEAFFDGTGYAGGTIKLGVDTVAISGDTAAADNAEAFFDGTGYAGTNNVIPTVTDVTNRVTANTDQIEGLDATDQIRDAILTDATRFAGANVDAAISTRATPAQVNSEVDTALADVNLDHLVGTATGIPAIPAGTYLDQIMDDGTASYDRTTDSLQAIRDQIVSSFTSLTAAAIADAVLEELISDHSGVAGSLAAVLNNAPDTFWDEVMEAGAPAAAQTARQWMRLFAAALLGESANTGDWSAKSLDSSKTRIAATLTATGERSSIDTLDGS